jgi:hypothetical protein
MPNIRTVNKMIDAKYPGYYLCQEYGYVYIWAKDTVEGGLHPAAWFSTNTNVCRVAQHTPEEWVEIVGKAIEHVKVDLDKFGHSMSEL